MFLYQVVLLLKVYLREVEIGNTMSIETYFYELKKWMKKKKKNELKIFGGTLNKL